MTKSTCSHPDCAKPTKCRDWCGAHYEALRRAGELKLLGPRSCSVSGCARRHESHGYCRNHRRKWQQWGNPLGLDMSLEARFWRKVTKTESCWNWDGSRNQLGYGHILAQVGELTRVMAHRASYEMFVGPIPAGLELDHLCRNPSCVNPEHLEPVTHAENLRRSPIGAAVSKRNKTHCPYGHAYAGENLIVNSKGRRECRTCRRADYLRYRDRNISARPAADQLPPAPGGATASKEQ